MSKLSVYKGKILIVLVSLMLSLIESKSIYQPTVGESLIEFVIESKPTIGQNFNIHSVAEIVKDRTLKRQPFEEYIASRKLIFEEENTNNFESDVQLNFKEERANTLIMVAKNFELDNGFANPYNFTPSRHFFEVVDAINNSKLFKIIQKMPKGGILHAHSTAMCSTNFLVNLTYREDLWQCNDSNNTIVTFIFSKNTPTSVLECNWLKVVDERARVGPINYDAQVRTRFTLFSTDPKNYKDINAVWNQLGGTFSLVKPILSYAPVLKDYYKEALKEMLKDGVQYLELRVSLAPVYDLDGKNYSYSEIIQFYVDGLNEFNAENPDFIGSKFIFAPLKDVPNQTIHDYIDIVTDLHSNFPDYVIGFDLVGQEDTSRRLLDLADKLLEIPDEIKFFYHAGETNWFGHTDENLFDAILLGSKRIGHGYALSKHPLLLKMVKELDIAIEVNPISNQVLKLVDDLRNHPAAIFFSQNVPLVISSDDPSFWEASLLSHDFYEAFLGIASARSDLRTLKKLATNSIKYSSLNKQEKEIAFSKWQTKWDQFIEEVIAEAI